MEAIADATSRKMVFERCVNWLLGVPTGVNDGVQDAVNTISVSPSTLSTEATLRYTIAGNEQQVNISMYDVLGNKVMDFGNVVKQPELTNFPSKAMHR